MDEWIRVACRKPEAFVRLLFFPHAGAGPALFFPWAKHLPSEIEVCSIQLPGHERRFKEAPLTEIGLIIKELGVCIRPYLNLPFIFFGHSMGALVSFELSRHLESTMKLSPAHLFVSGHRAPHLVERQSPLHNLPEDELTQELKRLNGTHEAIFQNAELMELALPVIRADLTACENYTYSPGERLHCPITAFGGLSDELVSRDEMDAWRMQTFSSFRVQMFQGGHFFYNDDREGFLGTLSAELRNICQRSRLK